jgi:GT2 family glycosyltransferase
MGMVRISIIIVTYNSKKYIDNCLKSLYEYNDIGDELEVIIVDNSPKDINNEMFSYIKETYKYPIKLIHNEKNGGYGQGNNIGIEAASGDIIAIMNPDIIHTESLFKQVISEFKNNNKLGMLGYKQLGGKEISFYIRQEFQKPIVTTLLTKLYNKINYFSKDRMYLSGAYFFTLKNNFKKIDLFD